MMSEEVESLIEAAIAEMEPGQEGFSKLRDVIREFYIEIDDPHRFKLIHSLREPINRPERYYRDYVQGNIELDEYNLYLKNTKAILSDYMQYIEMLSDAWKSIELMSDGLLTSDPNDLKSSDIEQNINFLVQSAPFPDSQLTCPP